MGAIEGCGFFLNKPGANGSTRPICGIRPAQVTRPRYVNRLIRMLGCCGFVAGSKFTHDPGEYAAYGERCPIARNQRGQRNTRRQMCCVVWLGEQTGKMNRICSRWC
jgi:hypothetical protein